VTAARVGSPSGVRRSATSAGAAASSASEPAGIHRENLEKVFARIWAVVVLVFGCQWISIAVAEDAKASVAAVSLALLLVEALAAASVIRSGNSAPSAASLQLVAAAAAAAAIIAVAGDSSLPGPHGAVGDGLLILLFPALASHAAYGRFARLAAPCVLTVAVGLALARHSPTGMFSLRSIPIESSLSTLANLVLVWGATRLLRHGARQADEVGEQTAALTAHQAAAQAAATAESNAKELVHDVVIHALFALSQPAEQRAAETAPLVRQAIEGLATPLTARRDSGPPVDAAATLGALVDGTWSATLPIEYVADESVLVPSEVAQAVRGAVNEALHNVRRHAHAGHVRLSLVSYRDGLMVVVQDDGVGFDPDLPVAGHYGIPGSIIARMLSVGGSAEVESRPGAGTTVTARWTPEIMIAAQGPPRAATRWSWVEPLGLSPRLIWATYFAPELSVSTIFAFVHARDARSPLLAAAVLLGLIGISAIGARAVARLELKRATAVALLLADALLVSIGIGLIRPGTQDGYAYWAIGAGLSTVTVLAAFRPARESVPAALLLIGLVDAIESSASIGATIGGNVAIVAAAAAGLAHRVAFARLTPIGDRYMTQLTETRASTERLRVLRGVEERRIAPVRRRVLPFLVTAQSADASRDPGEVDRAAELMKWTRRQLTMPGFFTNRISDLIAAGEAGGLKIEVSGSDPDEHTAALGRRLLENALGLPELREVKLSFAASSGRVTDLLLVLDCARPLPDATLGALAADDAVVIARGGAMASLRWHSPEPRQELSTSGLSA